MRVLTGTLAFGMGITMVSDSAAAFGCLYQMPNPQLNGTAKAGVGQSSKVVVIKGREKFTTTAEGQKVEPFPSFTRCPTTRYIVEVPKGEVPEVGQAFSVSIDPRIQPSEYQCVDLRHLSDQVTKMNFKPTDDGYSVSYTIPLNVRDLGNCHTLVRR